MREEEGAGEPEPAASQGVMRMHPKVCFHNRPMTLLAHSLLTWKGGAVGSYRGY